MSLFLGIGIIWACGIGVLAWKRPILALFGVIAGIHLFLIRFEVIGIPSTVLEFGIYGFVIGRIGAGLWYHRQESFAHIIAQWGRRVWQMWKLYLPALMIWLIPTLIAGLYGGPRGMGIIKAWFFDPIILILAIGSLIFYYPVERIRKSIVMGMLVSAIIMSVYGLFGGGQNGVVSGRLASYFETPNYVALYLVPILFLGCAFVWEHRKRVFYPRRFVVYWIILMLVFIRTLQLTDSYGGFVALAVAALMFIVCMPVRWMWKVGVLGLCVIGIVTALQFGAVSFSGHYNNFFKVDSISMRKELWQGALYLIEHDSRQPLTGIGLGQFQYSFWQLYYTAPDLFTLPYYLLDFHLPHSLYLTMAVEAGRSALFGFLLFVVMWLVKVMQAFARTKDIYVLAAFCAMIAILVHGLVDTPYFKNDLSVLFWMIVILGIMISCVDTELAQRKRL
ncbi:MAG TPA: O-antigen ligase family protein [Patescibacteria group bacterium]|nr:O-antigen ligase family protein [Patescibacteria group bacterium]